MTKTGERAETEKFWVYRRSARTQFMRSEYGRIFALGCLLLIGGISVIGFMAYRDYPLWPDIFSMSIAHMVAGRGVSVIQGLSLGLHPVVILILATYSDLVLMLIAYPVMVFTYQYFVESRVFQNHMRPVFDSARKRMDRFGRYKIAGVFVFVWLPLWMTGILAGSILGYLLGLRTWVTLTVAGFGTFSSILCWLMFSNQIFATLGWVNDRAVAVFVLVLLSAALFWRIRKRRKRLFNKH